MCLHVSSVNLNTIGLSMDVVGVILLIVKGLPPMMEMKKVNDAPNAFIYQWVMADMDDQEEMKKLYRRCTKYKRYLIFSVVLIIMGFVLQIISNYY